MKTTYSEWIDGNVRNHKLSVRFDKSGGYIGITQEDKADEETQIERVLLTPYQIKALVKFLSKKKRKKQ